MTCVPFSENQITCPRCFKIVEHAKKKLNDVKKNDKNELIGICAHCRLLQRSKPYHVSNDVMTKFVSKSSTAQDVTPQESEKARLSKIKKNTADTLDDRQEIELTRHIYSDLSISEIRQNSNEDSRQLKIRDIFCSDSISIMRNVSLSDTSCDVGLKQKREVSFSMDDVTFDPSYSLIVSEYGHGELPRKSPDVSMVSEHERDQLARKFADMKITDRPIFMTGFEDEDEKIVSVKLEPLESTVGATKYDLDLDFSFIFPTKPAQIVEQSRRCVSSATLINDIMDMLDKRNADEDKTKKKQLKRERPEQFEKEKNDKGMTKKARISKQRHGEETSKERDSKNVQAQTIKDERGINETTKEKTKTRKRISSEEIKTKGDSKRGQKGQIKKDNESTGRFKKDKDDQKIKSNDEKLKESKQPKIEKQKKEQDVRNQKSDDLKSETAEPSIKVKEKAKKEDEKQNKILEEKQKKKEVLKAQQENNAKELEQVEKDKLKKGNASLKSEPDPVTDQLKMLLAKQVKEKNANRHLKEGQKETEEKHSERNTDTDQHRSLKEETNRENNEAFEGPISETTEKKTFADDSMMLLVQSKQQAEKATNPAGVAVQKYHTKGNIKMMDIIIGENIKKCKVPFGDDNMKTDIEPVLPVFEEIPMTEKIPSETNLLVQYSKKVSISFCNHLFVQCLSTYVF